MITIVQARKLTNFDGFSLFHSIGRNVLSTAYKKCIPLKNNINNNVFRSTTDVIILAHNNTSITMTKFRQKDFTKVLFVFAKNLFFFVINYIPHFINVLRLYISTINYFEMYESFIICLLEPKNYRRCHLLRFCLNLLIKKKTLFDTSHYTKIFLNLSI